MKDHIGSIRLTTDETGTVISAEDYFAYGELLREHNSVERYKFTEKERDTETDYDYFGARYYDSELGRWLTVDPLADSYLAWSPYSYSGNNPINAIDLNGMEWVYIFVPGYGYMWVWQLPEITVTPPWWEEGINERFDRFNTENSSFEYAPPMPIIIPALEISAFAILRMSIVGMLSFSGDTDPHQKRLLMSEGAENAIDKVIEGSEQGKVSSSKQRHREGGEEQANKDFDDIVNAGGSSVQEYPNGVRTTKTPEGTHVTVRPSKMGSPTLEIIRPTGKVIKIRYK